MIKAVVGRNGSGKTQYIEQLRRQVASDRLRYIAFSDSYGPVVDKAYYLQLRWNQHDIDPETPNVGALLEKAYQLAGEDTEERRQLQRHLYDLFHMEPLLDKYVITLSSGELRKFQLTKTLFANPSLLIMDNPFIGLDAETRDQLKELLLLLAEKHRLDIILVLSKTDDIPTFVSEVIELRNGKILPPCSREDYYNRQLPIPPHVLTKEKREAILALPYQDNDYHTDEVIKMQQVSIRYGERTILKALDWTVRNGERWALSGQNGSGKSTLLSLVCADNPQSYACDITLFDRPRGSGESIWDIKKHIGYVSPEMHRSYQRDLPAIRIVVSGLKDSVGLYVKPNEDEFAICRFWMDIFGLEDKYNRTFMKLSSGEQRLVLLARAFVKDPQLLILDEPLHGLDLMNRRLVKDVIETFCERRNKTMVMVTHYEEELPPIITNKIYLTKQK
ncbi:MAG: ATP-binding cassette domain-containing protein [Prevotella sp.]|nr:ATP-binding cassette domain-containing protein [Prevotella sp.]